VCSFSAQFGLEVFTLKYSELPRYLLNLGIEEATNEDLVYIKEKIDKPVEPENIIILSSSGRRYLVIGRISIAENELEMFEYPYFAPHR